jgi:Uma2 family endonuclease
MAANLESILTMADLDAIPEDGNRYELIEGELFVTRAPGLTHQAVVRNLLYVLHAYLKEHPVGSVFPGPGIIFSDFSGVIPDLAYLSHERRKQLAAEDKITGAPELVIEVLSPGAENERRDRQAKRQLYKKYGVSEYWIVGPARQVIEVYRTSRLRRTATLRSRDEATTPLLPAFRCSVRSIFEE